VSVIDRSKPFDSQEIVAIGRDLYRRIAGLVSTMADELPDGSNPPEFARLDHTPIEVPEIENVSLEDVECPECGSKELKQLISSPNLATFSMMSPEEKVASMKRRSAEHTQKQIDKEPERWGKAGIDRRTKKVQA
jgi:hypothetical protein